MKSVLLILLAVIAIVTVVTLAIVNLTRFGKLPSGARLERIKKSPHYKNNAFENLSPTPALTEGVGYWEVMKDFFFVNHPRTTPDRELPSKKTDLLHLNPKDQILVWFGHSSYFMQLDGKRFLVDPVLSGHASPFSFSVNAFEGTNNYTSDDLPEIDYLIITHDHWDHLDYETLLKIKDKVKHIVCSLGTGEHLEYWGFDPSIITEQDWFESVDLGNGFKINTMPARHFSGRGFTRNKALWVSYILQTPTHKIYVGGDSGYDTHFKTIGEKYGPFDLAILENGQYNLKWRYIHLLPDEFIKAAKEINAKRIFPVHSSKFKLANHAWDEPLELLTQNKGALPIITPMIGESVNLLDTNQAFTTWWRVQ